MVGYTWATTLLLRISLSLMNQHDMSCVFDLFTKTWEMYM